MNNPYPRELRLPTVGIFLYSLFMSAQSLLVIIESYDEQIREIERKKSWCYEKLALLKKEVEFQHRYLIGKKAMCVHVDNPNPIECVCTAVVCNDDYLTVKPLFSRQGKKYIVDTYEWI